MTSPSMRSAVNAALALPRGEDVIAGVKNAVITELESLDSSVQIRTTDYFNHSFAPDMVLTWKESGRESVRNVFLRYSLRSATAGRDIEALGEFGPVLLALREEPDPEIIEEAREEVAEAPRLLLTDVPSLEDITARTGGGSRIDAGDVLSARQPLLQLVRGNVMRGGRGLLLSDTANILRLAGNANGSDDEIASIDAFTAVVGNLFVEDAAARLERAGQLLRMGISGDTTDLLGAHQMDPDEPTNIIGGRLSETELSVLLPYLLSREDVTDDPLYWSHLGSMLSLKRLEDMATQLEGLDLTRLVAPNLQSWTGTRASASFDVDALDGGSDTPDGQWRLHGRMLSTAVGAWLVHLTNDRRKIGGRKDSAPARWEDLNAVLGDFSLAAVTLQGLIRRVRVDAERAEDIYRDISTITSNLEDSFRIPEIELRGSSGEESAVIVADFTRMIAEARGRVSAADLVRVAVEILAHDRS